MVVMPAAPALAEFSSSLRLNDVPAAVLRAAQVHVADSIGVALAAADPDESSSQALGQVSRLWSEGGGATVLGVGTRCTPDRAALVNGALAQALEMDDKHGPSLMRPGATVTPAALAIAEQHGSTIGQLVTAVVAGYEVMIRLGSVARERFLARGYHTSSLIGGFGAAAAVGNLRSASAAVIADALGIVGTFASGIQEATRTGSTSKILHGGWGAHAGIMAADLASCGITGPSSVFEGQSGFFLTHLSPVQGELDWGAVTEGLGSQWHLPDTAIKPYPCCQLLHSFIEGIKTLRPELQAAGIKTADIQGITCRLAEPGLTLVTQPADRKARPSEPHEARFSLPYVVAHTLEYGDVDLATFHAAALSDPAVQTLAAKVGVADDPDSDYPRHNPAVIDIAVGGRTFSKRVRYHPGCPEAPLTEQEILSKFASNSQWLLGSTAEQTGRRLLALPASAPVSELIEAVRQPAGEKGNQDRA
jgi:2-methylcitrate dehydratase PrpD